MNRDVLICLICAVLVLGGSGSAATAGEALERSGSAASAAAPVRCACGSAVCHCSKAPAWDRHARSGYGQWVAPWAVASYGPDYKSYYVGGSMLPWRGARTARPERRSPWEGTWGTDYAPTFTSVELWWTHGRLHQDGGGQYEPDRTNRPFFLRFGKEPASRE